MLELKRVFSALQDYLYFFDDIVRITDTENERYFYINTLFYFVLNDSLLPNLRKTTNGKENLSILTTLMVINNSIMITKNTK